MYSFRWMIRSDMPKVLDIENRSFEFPWSENDFIRLLMGRNHIGMVACDGDQVIGFMIYAVCKGRIEVQHFAVDPDRRRRGVGTAMINKMKSKLSMTRRATIIFGCPDQLLDVHLFLQSQGFVAVKIFTDYYRRGMDMYHFEFRLKESLCVPTSNKEANKASHGD